MQIYEVILIGLALSIDACAVTIANCATYKDCLNKKKEWSMPLFFAVFQGVMPLIGYLIGSLFANIIAPIAKFVTAAIFLFLAVKLIIDMFKKEEENTCPINSLAFSTIALQAVATSIDALAVGVTFIGISCSIILAVSIIAGVTFLLVSFALIFGKTLGNLFGKYAEWLGAGILLALSIKSLIEAFL